MEVVGGIYYANAPVTLSVFDGLRQRYSGADTSRLILVMIYITVSIRGW